MAWFMVTALGTGPELDLNMVFIRSNKLLWYLFAGGLDRFRECLSRRELLRL
jgi:hypothetical protein